MSRYEKPAEPYSTAANTCARHYGVAHENVALVNGLDEGILAAAVAHLTPSPDGGRFEAIVPEPAFEIFSFLTEVVNGQAVRIPPRADFSCPLEEILESITPRTRVVWVTNPNNPSLASFPNVVVGRTFAKAHGLAGLNIGAVYVRQVEESKALVYDGCDHLGLTYWRSAANFVLIRTGGDVPALVAAAEASAIYLRDRSNEPGCAGCIRLTTGIVEHTRRALAVLDEVLCAAR